MPYPNKPADPYDYVGYQANEPTLPLPAPRVAGDFNSQKRSIDAVIDFLKVTVRSDHKVQPKMVPASALAPDALAIIGDWNPRGDWATAQNYAKFDMVYRNGVNYVAIASHTSDVFSTDISAGKWQALEADLSVFSPPDIATLRLYQGPATTAEVVAGAAFGDGIGGAFAVKPSDTATSDDGIFVVVDAVGRRWWRLDTSTTGGADDVSVATMAALRLYKGSATTADVIARSSFGDGGGGTFAVNAGDTTTADDGALVIVDALGRRWWRSYTDWVDVRWWGAAVSASASVNATAIQAAIDAMAGTVKGVVFIPSGGGKYQVDTSILEKDDVTVMGVGPRATDIEGTGNFPVFLRNGNAVTGIRDGGIINLGIWSVWRPEAPSSNTSAFGISCLYGYRGTYRDIKFFGCYAGHYSQFSYEMTLDNVEASGIGSGEQCRYGFLWEEVTALNNNNAHKAVNCVASSTYSDGWRLLGFAGTTFIGCRGEACGGYGWHIGDPTTAGSPVGLGTWIGCFGDAGMLGNWLISKGVGSRVYGLQFSACESGGSPIHGWWFIQVEKTSMVGCNDLQAGQNALRLDRSPVQVIGFTAEEYCQDAGTPSNGIAIIDTDGAIISGCDVSSNEPSAVQSVAEYGTSNNNVVTGNQLANGAVKIGAGSSFTNNKGYVTENKGTDTIASGTTAKDVAHGLSVTPTAGDMLVNFTEQGASDYGRVWLSDFGATTFRVNVSANPGASGLDFAWGARVL